MNAILLLTLLAVPGQVAPLVCDPPVAECGQMRGGPVLHQRFTLTNKGQAALAIVEAQTSCGCFTPKFGTRSLKPGETTTLDLDIGTLTQPDGDNLWALRLFYRVDGAEAAAAVDVRVKATLIREVGVTPAALRLIGGPNLSHEITLTDRRATPLEIIAVRSAAGRIAAENGAWAKVDGVWMRKIRVRMAADCPAGRFEETLVIYGRDPDYRELRVTVNGERRDPRRYQLEPAEVALTVTPGKLVPTAIVLLRERDGQPVEIDRVESDDPALQCRFAEGANPTASIRIDVAPDRTPARSSNLTIHVRTPVPQKVVVRVGVHE